MTSFFYVIAEGRPGGGKLRKVYLDFANRSHGKGRCTASLQEPMPFDLSQAKRLARQAAIEMPEWGIAIKPA
jgi:hypothetical protein